MIIKTIFLWVLIVMPGNNASFSINGIASQGDCEYLGSKFTSPYHENYVCVRYRGVVGVAK